MMTASPEERVLTLMSRNRRNAGLAVALRESAARDIT
jgi:hypothetical protein